VQTYKIGKAETHLKGKTKYWLGLALALGGGFLLVLTPLPHCVAMLFHLPSLEDLLRKLGDAFFIAGVLALLVDTALKEELLTEFAHDISIHIIGELLPLGLRDHLRSYLETPIVRPAWTITYVIEPHEDPQYVQLRVSSSYSVENYSRKELGYLFRVKVERSWYTQYDNSIESLDYGEGLKQKSDLVGDANHYKDDGRGNIVYARDIRIPPRASGAIPKIFNFELIQHYWEHSFCILYAISVVMKTTVIVKSPPGQFKVDLDLTFSENVPLPSESNVSGQEQKKWEFDEPILPGQGFFVRWKRVQN
jgi:hypothetical protein